MLAVVVYAVFVAYSDIREFVGQLETFAIWTFPAALALVSVGYLFRSWRWHVYLNLLGSRVTGTTSVLTFLSGFAMGITPGKFGELVKTYYLMERAGTPYARSLSASVAERATDLVALALLLAGGLLAFPGLGLVPFIVTCTAALLGLFLLRSERAANPILRLLERARIFRKTVGYVRSMQHSLRILLSSRALLAGVVIGLAAWAVEVWAMWLLARGFGLDLSWSASAFVFAAASIAGVLSMLPGGLGATEGGMVALLVYLQVALPSATALTLAVRLATLWFSVVLGALAIALLRTSARAATRMRAPDFQ